MDEPQRARPRRIERPRRVRRVTTRSISLYPEEWIALEEHAYGNQVSPSEVVRQWVRSQLGVPESPAEPAALAS
jgi:hypothetical protein